MFSWRIWMLVTVLCFEVFFKTDCKTSNPKTDNYGRVLLENTYEKRPFCNAFTGCGKKRSYFPQPRQLELEQQQQQQLQLQQQQLELQQQQPPSQIQQPPMPSDLGQILSDFIDINAEPAVKDVQQQIMSQAKLYEAIKEASREIYIQKNNQMKMDPKEYDQLLLSKEQVKRHYQLM